MNIGLLIRGAKGAAKLAGKAAKATGRGAKAGARATGRGAKAAGSKAKSAAKAAGKTKVAQGAKRVGGKVVENVGYASTSGLKRSKTGKYFKGGGSKPIRSVSKAAVRKTGKRVTAGASAIAAGGETARRKSKSNKQAAAAKAKRDAAAAKARAATSKTAAKTPAKKAAKRALPAFAKLGKKSTAKSAPKKYTMIRTNSSRFGGSGKTKVEVGSSIIRNKDGSIKKINPPSKKK